MGPLDAFLLKTLTSGMKAGGEAFVTDVFETLNDEHLVYFRKIIDKILQKRSEVNSKVVDMK